MIEITKDQCTRMLVWDEDESRAKPMDVFAYVKDDVYKYIFLKENGEFGWSKHAKPLPEPKEMTALDVMWWAGTRKVIRHKSTEEFYSLPEYISNQINPSHFECNELSHKDGKTTLLYDTWKTFTFDNCDMGEE